jgi:hypothetical protein
MVISTRLVIVSEHANSVSASKLWKEISADVTVIRSPTASGRQLKTFSVSAFILIRISPNSRSLPDIFAIAIR